MQSHEAEFADHGLTRELPKRRQTWKRIEDETWVGIRDVVNGKVIFYGLEGTRSIKDSSLPLAEFLSRFTREYMPNELDEKWAQLVKEGDPNIVRLESAYQETVEMAENLLIQLRLYAREKFLKG